MDIVSMHCPEPDMLEEYLVGSPPSGQRAALAEHLDGCEECRRTVAVLAPGLPRQDTAVQDAALAPTISSGPFRTERPLGGRVSRYILGDSIGAGGMGVVYAADDPELHREVAVKLLGADQLAEGAAARDRVVHEARALARISHPNVVAVYDAGTVGDQVFIAMELVKGRNMRVHLAEARPSAAEILDLFLAAGQGIAAAHEAGVVHRDFKPDNVLVGDDGRVRVTDFGLAVAAAGRGGARGTATPGHATDASGVVAGTPAYMAPEQHDGAHVDPRSDQFSFCVALYEALFRQRPFVGTTRDELASAIRDGRVTPPPGRARVPRSLSAIVLRGLSPDPAGRFPNMDALLRALARDRARPLRRIALTAAVVLVVVAVALLADWVLRSRAAAVARTSFAAARAQLGHLVALRTENFVAVADLSYMVPILRDVAGVSDQADFGLDDAESDRVHLEELHENLASADWVSWVRATQGAELAVADYKGRLLYASAAPERWGSDVRELPAVREAYEARSSAPVAFVVRGDDPALHASGLMGGAPRGGLQLLFARLTVLGGRPRSIFVQVLPGARLLSELSLGDGTQISLVALDGTAEGPVAAAVVAAGLEAREIEEVSQGGQPWLVQHHPLTSPGSGRPIAYIVLARPATVGLAGLFPGARTVLGALAFALAALAIAAAVLARRRDLGRRRSSL